MGGYNNRGFVEVLAASQSNVNKNWFQGTADAVRQYMWLFEETVRDGVEEYLILSGGWSWDLNHSHSLSGVMICMMMRHSRLATRSCDVHSHAWTMDSDAEGPFIFTPTHLSANFVWALILALGFWGGMVSVWEPGFPGSVWKRQI